MLPTVITEMENVSDRQFMADLYENYHRLMYRTAAKCAPDRDEQDEAVQDALVRLIAKVSLMAWATMNQMSDQYCVQCSSPRALPASVKSP